MIDTCRSDEKVLQWNLHPRVQVVDGDIPAARSLLAGLKTGELAHHSFVSIRLSLSMIAGSRTWWYDRRNSHPFGSY